jgi:hypothetical protein
MCRVSITRHGPEPIGISRMDSAWHIALFMEAAAIEAKNDHHKVDRFYILYPGVAP